MGGSTVKIAICDDETLCQKQILNLAKEYAQKNNYLDLSISTFSNGEDVLEAARKFGGFELYILDILMPGMDGVTLGKALREAGFDGKIIYLTFSSFREPSISYFYIFMFKCITHITDTF